mmetsp:Transcript_15553/g.34090  ORF Transcript_15553/g.34090 Transcript_15553/m.34090 type:complete len:267 (-) Transcript_15553:190-990(-)
MPGNLDAPGWPDGLKPPSRTATPPLTGSQGDWLPQGGLGGGAATSGGARARARDVPWLANPSGLDSPYLLTGGTESPSSSPGGRGAGRTGGGANVDANAAAAKAKVRVPLSGGGPKRTDYLKKYGGGGAAEEGEEQDQGQAPAKKSVPITTMMLKNIPCRKSQEEVMQHIDLKGFDRRYDFFYLPRDVKFRANLGYAFINFATPEGAANFLDQMNGYRFSNSGSTKACVVVPAHVQGLKDNLAVFKRTEVMRSNRKPYFLQGAAPS